MNALDEIKTRIAREYRETGRFDPAPWLAAHPEWHDELDRFFAVFGPALESSAETSPQVWWDASGTTRQIQRNIAQIASVRSADAQETDLGRSLATLPESTVAPPSGGIQEYWMETKAAIFSFLVDTFRRKRRGQSGRYDANKSVYLDQRLYRLNLFEGFRPARYGMFNSALYRVEEFAQARGWVNLVEGRRYRAGPKVEEALSLARARVVDPALAQRLADHLAENRHALELWGMVDFASLKLVEQGQRITVSAIVETLKGVKEWQWKEDLYPFVPEALAHLIRLELVPAHLVDFEEDEHTG